MGSTSHYNLITTPASTAKTFREWRLEMAGETDSNMTKIDEAIYNAASTDTTLSVSGKAADAKKVGDEIADVKGAIYKSQNLDYSGATIYNCVLSSVTGKWYVSNDYQSYFAPLPNNAKKISITANASQPTVFAMLKSDAHVESTTPDYATGCSRVAILAGESQTFDIPDDCHVIYLLKSDTVDYTPSSAIYTIDGVAAIAEDVDGVQSAIEQSGLVFSESLNIDSYPTENIAIGTDNKWSPSGRSKFISVSEFIRQYGISVKSHAQNGSVVCLLKSRNYTAYATVDYATGTHRTFIPANETREFFIPDDCNYINILDYWGSDYLPQNVDVTKSQIAEMMKNRIDGDQIGLTNNAWTLSACVLSTVYDIGTGNNKQGAISSADSSLMASDFIPVVGEMLELPLPVVSGTEYPNFGMCLYDGNRQPINGRCVSAMPNGDSEHRLIWVHVYIPKNAKYFRTTYWTSESYPEFSYNLLACIPNIYKPITHELPVDTYMQNSIRRARQLTDIKWTPRVNIPRYSMINGGNYHFLDWFYNGKEYIGIPYSGSGGREGTGDWTTPKEWGYAHNWVGSCIPLEAFVTAARFPNSIFSETTGQTQPDYSSSPFGIVCTGLVNYAVNGPLPLRQISGFFNTPSREFRTKPFSNTIADIPANDIMIGDFLYTAPHVIMITDLIRDSSGNVTHVEMSEATTVGNGNNAVLGTKFGGVARRKMWEYQVFKNIYGNYEKYRKTTFYGIPYIQSSYVDTGNEGDCENIQDLPCIPYLGNGAIYRENYIHNSKICIGATGFTTLVVTKDGEPFDTFNVEGLDEISVGFTSVGDYEAYLTNGTTRTIACHWSVASGTL